MTIADMKIKLLNEYLTVAKNHGLVSVEYLTALRDVARMFEWNDIVEKMQAFAREEFKRF